MMQRNHLVPPHSAFDFLNSFHSGGIELDEATSSNSPSRVADRVAGRVADPGLAPGRPGGDLEGVLTLIDEALQKPPPGLAARGHPPSGEG